MAIYRKNSPYARKGGKILKILKSSANAMTDTHSGTHPRKATDENMEKINAYIFEEQQVEIK